MVFSSKFCNRIEKIKVEVSLRASFIGIYITPDKKKIWICIIPYIPIYIKLKSN